MASPITREELAAANTRGRRALARGPTAIATRYEKGRIVVDLNNGCTFAFPPDQAQGLAGADAADLAVIEITPSGLGLHWPKLDADLHVPSLMQGVMGTRQWMAQIGRTGGKATSSAKAAAARTNGTKGGRPKTTATLR
jgi:Protein of unknown function (DUF2442)